MKVALVLAAACLPLAILTVRSFVDAGTAARDAEPADDAAHPLDADRLAEQARQAQTRGEQQAAYLRSLSEADPVGASSESEGVGPPATELTERPFHPSGKPLPLNRLHERLGAAQRSRRGVAAAVAALGGRRAEDLTSLERFTRETFPAALQDLRGADSLARYVSSRIEALQSKRTTAQLLADTEAALEETRTEAARGPRGAAERISQLRQALARLDRLDVAAQPADVAERVRELRRRLSFWIHWQVAWEGDKPAEGLKALRERLTDAERRRQGNPPPAVREDETRYVGWLEAEAESLRGAVAVEEFVLVAGLPPDETTLSTETFLERLDAFASAYPDRVPQLRGLFKSWVEARLPEKTVPEGEDRRVPAAGAELREARRKDGTLLVGFFEDTSSRAKPWWYFYPTAEDFRTRSAERRVQVYLFELQGPPGTPTPLTVLDEYAAARERLLKRVWSRESWQQFAEVCEELGERLARYGEETGAWAVSLEFTADQALAETVLEHWQTVESVSGK